ncbi:MAG: hypothetical protein M5U19_08755 [Microthrixaceae bacterium]|nr:hypothetical protein [Microthrixaceae bacterium]
MADPGRLDDPGAPSDVDLEGTWSVTLADGSAVEVTPVFSLLRRRLAQYPPEVAAEICGVHPDTIRDLARRVAGGRTKVQNGLGSCKHHHGDLMERSVDLLLALTGNWGSPGRGLDTYIIALMEGEILGILKGSAGIDAAESTIQALDMFLDAMNASDPAMTDGRAVTEMMHSGAATMSATPPGVLLLVPLRLRQALGARGLGRHHPPVRRDRQGGPEQGMVERPGAAPTADHPEGPVAGRHQRVAPHPGRPARTAREPVAEARHDRGARLEDEHRRPLCGPGAAGRLRARAGRLPRRELPCLGAHVRRQGGGAARRITQRLAHLPGPR